MENMKNGKEYWEKAKACLDSEVSVKLGPYWGNAVWNDVKHVGFTLSRYKFASKMLMYKSNIKLLELGCAEAVGSQMFLQNNDLKEYIGVDFDEQAIEWNRKNLSEKMKFVCGDFLDGRVQKELENKRFDAFVSLDVIEHLLPELENKYCETICKYLEDDGVAIIGTPNIMMNPYACEASKAGHINLYDHKRLYELMNLYFHNVFIFSMNDEVVHTGFAPMSCYIFALCCNKKE